MENTASGPHRRVPSSASARTARDHSDVETMENDQQYSQMKRHALCGPLAPASFWRRMTWRRWIAVVIFFTLSVLLAGPLVGLRPQLLLVSHDGLVGGQEQVGISLHPNAHRSRPPKTLHFDWTITTGIRRPDGVKKKVYLVNGKLCGLMPSRFTELNSNRSIPRPDY